MNLPILLVCAFIFSYILNYIYLNSKKTAFDIVNDMGMGYNLGNVLTFNCCSNFEELKLENEQIKNYETIFPTKHNINKIKKYGFKTIRFQVTYMKITNDNGKLNSEWISKIKEIIKFILNENMYFILSVRHDGEFWKKEGKNGKDKYVSLWNQIANELMNYDEHLIFESNNNVNYEPEYTFIEDDINIEVDDDYISYGSDYPSDMSRDDDYNDYDFFDNNYYIPLLNTTQSFIDIIRNTGGLNKERLLIIAGINNELELSNSFTYEMPNDPANKTAISLHYYIPLEFKDIYSEDISLDWFDINNNYYETTPIKEWGSIQNYKTIIEKFNLLKTIFLDKGIPVIITEVGMMTEQKKENNSIIEFLYVLFSITEEFDGIMSCLWDISEKIGEDIYFYNKETNQWKDKKIINNLYKISKLKYIQISEFYIETNLVTETETIDGRYFINLETKKPLKVLLNARYKGDFNIDFSFGILIFINNYDWIIISLEKEFGKKQYDGTTLFTIDVSTYDCFNIIEAFLFHGEDCFIVNNITVEFEESFISFDYKSYKSAVVKAINS